MTTMDVDPVPAAAPAVDEYVEAVAALSGAATAEERDELLADVRAHLDEAIADDGEDLAAALGTPDEFAREFLSAAGVEPHRSAERRLRLPGSIARSIETMSMRVGRVRERYPELAAAMVVARGWLWAEILVAVLGGSTGLVPRLFGSAVVGAAVVALGVWASLGLNRRRADGSRSRLIGVASVVGTLAAFIAAVGFAVGSDAPPEWWAYSAGETVGGGCLVNGDGAVIENLYPYDVEGRALRDVLLYDQTGHPVDNLCPSDYDASGRRIETTYARDVNGAPVINAFPRRQTRGAVTYVVDEETGIGREVISDGERVPPPAVVVPRVAAPVTSAAPSTTTSAVPTTTTPAPLPTGFGPAVTDAPG